MPVLDPCDTDPARTEAPGDFLSAREDRVTGRPVMLSENRCWPAAMGDLQCLLLSVILTWNVAPMWPTVPSLEGTATETADPAGRPNREVRADLREPWLTGLTARSRWLGTADRDRFSGIAFGS
jgi:hypothetical protein